jgi:hypothetical protein
VHGIVGLGYGSIGHRCNLHLEFVGVGIVVVESLEVGLKMDFEAALGYEVQIGFGIPLPF